MRVKKVLIISVIISLIFCISVFATEELNTENDDLEVSKEIDATEKLIEETNKQEKIENRELDTAGNNVKDEVDINNDIEDLTEENMNSESLNKITFEITNRIEEGKLIKSYSEAITTKKKLKKENNLSKFSASVKTYMGNIDTATLNSMRAKIISGIDNVEDPIEYSFSTVSNDLQAIGEEIQAYSDEMWADLVLAPEYFYLNAWQWGISMSGNSSGINITVTVTPTYLLTKEEVVSYRAKIQKTVEDYLNDIDQSMDDLNKIIFTHNYICQLTEYDWDVYNNYPGVYHVSHTMVGPLVNGLAVCDGYSKAFQYLLSKVGINSMLVASDALDHAWNHVSYNGNFYNIDVTWDDSKVTKNIEICYDYFMASDSKFYNQLEHNSEDWEYTESATSTLFDTATTPWRNYNRFLVTHGNYVYKLLNGNKVEKWSPTGNSAISSVTYGISSYDNAFTSDKNNMFILGNRTRIYSLNFDENVYKEYTDLPANASLLEYRAQKFYYDVVSGTKIYIDAPVLTEPTVPEQITTKTVFAKKDKIGNDISVISFAKSTAILENNVSNIITKENFPCLNNGNISIIVTDKNGNVKTGTDRIGTRSILIVNDSVDGELARFNIAVNGDVDGDGRARIFDSFTILEDTFGNYDYDDIDYMTRDYDGDQKIRIFDAFSYLEDSI